MQGLRSFEDIYLVSDRTAPITKDEIRLAQDFLGTAFPDGYEEFMLRFGEGDFSGYFRPYPPNRIVKELSSNREHLSNDFWDDGELRVSLRQREQLVVFADTIDSDCFAFSPAKPSDIYLFPRQDTKVFQPGKSFLDVLNWVSSAGKTVQPFKCFFFQPWNDGASLRLKRSGRDFSLDEMMAIFQNLGSPDYAAVDKEARTIDFFLRNYGAHLSYLLMDRYAQFIIGFDSKSADEFLPLLTAALCGKSFTISESKRIERLPDLS
jgi:hypothetical protein